MSKKEIERFIPKFRTGSKSIKEFYALSRMEKDAYILELINIPLEDRSDVDKHILKFYSIGIVAKENFFAIPDIY